MHILRQFLLVRLSITFAVLFVGVFATAFAIGLSRLSEATRWNEHTNRVLAQLSLTQELSETAFMTARMRLLGDPAIPDLLETQRANALAALDTLSTLMSDNPEQSRNIVVLRNALERRFVANDVQFAKMRRDDNVVTFTRASVDNAIDTASDVERAFMHVRVAEINILQQRDAETNALFWKVSYVMIGSVSLAMASTILTLIALLRALKFRETLVAELKQKAGIDGGGLSAKEVLIFRKKIEGALVA